MSHTILATKLFAPQPRKNLVERQRLISRLEEGIRQGSRLTLVSAPAGFGKTTLISAWICAADPCVPVAWLSLDEGENDPVQFLLCLIAALQKVDPSIGQAIQPVLESPQGSQPTGLVERLINDVFSIETQFLLVLDDYHRVNSLVIHRLVQLIIERQPATMHTVILTRVDPLLPLPKLRARGEITEIRERDLKFTEEEAVAFLRGTMRLELDADEIAVLASRTEGWIAGLQLAAIALQEYADVPSMRAFISSFAGSDRYVVDYLASEVLDLQPEKVRDFLMRTSILERMCGSLCDAIVDGTQQNNSSEMLNELERANMFVAPLDNHRQWYRYHHLFSDLLRHSLRQHEGARIPELHRRASRWFETNGLLDEAVQHAQKSEDWTYAADLVERHAMDQIALSQVSTLRAWCTGFPETVIQARPGLCIFLAWALMLTFRTDYRELVQARIQHAVKALEKKDTPAYSGVGPGGARVFLADWVKGQVCALRSQLLLAAIQDRVDPQALISLSLQSLELLPEVEKPVRSICSINLAHAYMMLCNVEEAVKALAEALHMSLDAGNYYTAVTAYFYQARVAFHQGRLHRAMAICQEGLAELLPRFNNPDLEFPAIRSLYVMQGIIHLEWNDLDEAERLLGLGANLVGWAPWVELVGYAVLVRLKEIKGEFQQAEAILTQMEKMGPQFMYCAEAMRTVQLALRSLKSEEALERAAQWIEKLRAHFRDSKVISGIGPYQVDAEYITYYAWLQGLIATGQAKDALESLEPVIAFAQEKGLLHRVIQLSVLQGLAMAETGDAKGANVIWTQALTLAQPEGYVNVFNLIPGFTQWLAGRADREGPQEFAERLLTAFRYQDGMPASTTQTATTLPQSKRAILIEPLSERELEVLRNLVDGHSLAEVARKLYLSPNTLKAHTQNIYSKLDVHSRLEAVNKARELGLL